jgi:L-malate glycosyltransferase
MKSHLCIVGNLLGRNPGSVTTQGQIIADLFSREGYDVISVSSKRNRLARLVEVAWTIARYRKLIDISIIEVYSGLALILADMASLLAKYSRIPLVLVLHGGNLPDFTKRHPRWVRRVLRRADILVAPSKFLAEEFERYGLRTRVIPNVIDLDHYPNLKRGRISPKLIWMRSFHDIYNPHMALEVLRQLKDDYPAATLVMAGADKGLENQLKDRAAAEGLDESVRFPGFLDHDAKVREFSAADVYLNTNRIDNMPVSILEAWAMGLPVVATNVGGVPYLIEPSETGLLVDDGDVRGMVEAVKSLLKDPELANRLSTQGSRQAEQSSWTFVRQKWEEVFRQLTPHKSIAGSTLSENLAK